jgi:hypothetical protein
MAGKSFFYFLIFLNPFLAALHFFSASCTLLLRKIILICTEMSQSTIRRVNDDIIPPQLDHLIQYYKYHLGYRFDSATAACAIVFIIIIYS